MTSNPSFDFILVKTAVNIITVNKEVIKINGLNELCNNPISNPHPPTMTPR